MRKVTLLFAVLLFVPILSMAQTVTVTTNITTDTEWTADNEYLLDGMIFVTEGADLYIEAGTTVRGRFGQGLDASGLVITRDSRIFAEGTAENPIIFTAEDDGLTKDDVGEWGGVVILGSAPTNNATEASIEGVNEIESDPALVGYGGTDVMDDSGVLRYVSIRHTGINIGSSSGNEIQGLTLGGVGAGTTIEYVESFASGDDGFEWFGGTVNTRYLISAFNEDDAFDWDQGYQGKGQFWFAILDSDQTGRAAEMDGATGNETGSPYTYGVVSNATYIGPGIGSTPSGDSGQMLQFRDNTGALYTNSVFTDHPGDLVNVEDVDGTDIDSRGRLEADSLNISNSVFFGFGSGNTLADISNAAFVETMLSANSNNITDPQLNGISRTNDGGLDPRPGNSSILSGADIPDDPFFKNVAYKGAFGGSNWAAGWTALDQYGYLADSGTPGTITINSNITTDTYWTADNEYLLNGMIFVTEGADLYIEAGTTVRGAFGQGLDASGLVITRDSRIFAEGAPGNPIIFTAEDDNLTKDDVGEWGGVVILGSAPTNNATEAAIEGVNEIESDPALVGYGGTDEMDDSGIMRYVSIRHTGINIGSSSGNEIQGLTLGGVGAGTTIEYVESFASGDDGFEWFGGTVNTRYLVSAFNEDDAFDWDQGYQGKGQFWFAILDSDQTGRAAEMDGATGNETGSPYTYGQVANATYIGPGINSTPSGDSGQMLQFRDNTGALYTNSVFTDHPGNLVNVEDVDGTDIDSRGRLEADSLNISNSVFFEFGTGSSFADISNAGYVESMLDANSNSITDPMLRGISRTNDGGLDPRPMENSSVYGLAGPVDDDWFYPTNYVGAFDGSNWLAGWTALDSYGFLGQGLVTDIEDVTFEVPEDITLRQNFPNPFNPTTQIGFTLPQSQEVSLRVYDMLGREVATLASSEMFSAGQHTLSFDASSLSSGVYVYRLTSQDIALTRSMTLIK